MVHDMLTLVPGRVVNTGWKDYLLQRVLQVGEDIIGFLAKDGHYVDHGLSFFARNWNLLRSQCDKLAVHSKVQGLGGIAETSQPQRLQEGKHRDQRRVESEWRSVWCGL